MNKVYLGELLPSIKEIKHNGTTVEVLNFLTVAQQAFLINAYLETYFSKLKEPLIEACEYNHMEAKFELIGYLYQLMTNIDMDKFTNDFYVDSVLYQKVTGAIDNYEGFLNNLEQSIFLAKEQLKKEHSIETTLKDLIAKAFDVLEKLANISPETIEKARVSGLELAAELEKSSVMGRNFKPAKKAKKLQ